MSPRSARPHRRHQPRREHQHDDPAQEGRRLPARQTIEEEERSAQGGADESPESDLPGGAREDARQEAAGSGAERGTDADLLTAPGDGERHERVDARSGEEEDGAQQEGSGEVEQPMIAIPAARRGGRAPQVVQETAERSVHGWAIPPLPWRAQCRDGGSGGGFKLQVPLPSSGSPQAASTKSSSHSA